MSIKLSDRNLKSARKFFIYFQFIPATLVNYRSNKSSLSRIFIPESRNKAGRLMRLLIYRSTMIEMIRKIWNKWIVNKIDSHGPRITDTSNNNNSEDYRKIAIIKSRCSFISLWIKYIETILYVYNAIIFWDIIYPYLMLYLIYN